MTVHQPIPAPRPLGIGEVRALPGTLALNEGRATLRLVLLLQSVLMFFAIPVTASKDVSPAVIVLIAALIGANYGANLSLFPSITKDLWGLKKFGINYGLLFTAWGVGGFILLVRSTCGENGKSDQKDGNAHDETSENFLVDRRSFSL